MTQPGHDLSTQPRIGLQSARARSSSCAARLIVREAGVVLVLAPEPGAVSSYLSRDRGRTHPELPGDPTDRQRLGQSPGRVDVRPIREGQTPVGPGRIHDRVSLWEFNGKASGRPWMQFHARNPGPPLDRGQAVPRRVGDLWAGAPVEEQVQDFLTGFPGDLLGQGSHLQLCVEVLR